MTVKTLKVENFQSIKSAELELGQFTVLSGPSSSGKSAVLRAAQALFRNNFNPNQVRQGCSSSDITAEIDDHKVSVSRGRSKSTYYLDDKVFTKAGRTVPDSVAEVLNMEPLAGVDTTFSTQFDKPYLLAESGSIGSQVIGTLTNVATLHDGLRETNRRALSTQATLKVKKADVIALTDRIHSFDGLEAKEHRAAKAEGIIRNVETTSTKLSEVDALIQSTQVFVEALSSLYVPDVDTLDSISEALESLVLRVEHIRTLQLMIQKVIASQTSLSEVVLIPLTAIPTAEDLADIDLSLKNLVSLSSYVATTESKANTLKAIKISEVPEVSDELVKKVTTITTLRDLTHKISSIRDAAVAAVKSYQEAIVSSESASTQHDYLLRELKLCPLCGNELHVD